MIDTIKRNTEYIIRERTIRQVLKIIDNEMKLQKNLEEYVKSGMDSREPSAIDAIDRIRKAILALREVCK